MENKNERSVNAGFTPEDAQTAAHKERRELGRSLERYLLDGAVMLAKLGAEGGKEPRVNLPLSTSERVELLRVAAYLADVLVQVHGRL